jgi:hypothetical protein
VNNNGCNRPEADFLGKKNSPMNSGYFFASKNRPVLATAQNHQKTGRFAKKVHCEAK